MDPRVAEKFRLREAGKVEVNTYPAVTEESKAADPASVDARFHAKFARHEARRAMLEAEVEERELESAMQLPNALRELEEEFNDGLPPEYKRPTQEEFVASGGKAEEYEQEIERRENDLRLQYRQDRARKTARQPAPPRHRPIPEEAAKNLDRAYAFGPDGRKLVQYKLPTLEEFIAAGNEAETYHRFVAEHASLRSEKKPEELPAGEPVLVEMPDYDLQKQLEILEATPGASNRPPTIEEYVQAGYKAEEYDRFIAFWHTEHAKMAGPQQSVSVPKPRDEPRAKPFPKIEAQPPGEAKSVPEALIPQSDPPARRRRGS